MMHETRPGGVRRVLDAVYAASSILAAAFLALIAAVVLAQILTRLLGINFVGADEFASWSMAASVFLALPRTLVTGGHIRVTMILEVLPQRIARGLAAFSALVGVAVGAWSAFSVWGFVWASWTFADKSQGELAAPLWVPQLSMLFGFSLLFVAFADLAIRQLTGVGLPGEQIDQGSNVQTEGL